MRTRALAILLVICLTLGANSIAGVADPAVPGRPAPRTAGFLPPEREWAVLVGVSKYAKLPQARWLDGCDLDAQALGQFLASPRGGAFPADHIQLLVNEGATTTAIRLAMDHLIKKAKAGDVVYIFFACHGKVERYGSGEVAYLMPYDSDPDHLNATALPMDEIRRYVDINLAQAQVVLISDCCHAGGLAQGEAEGRRPVSVSEHLISIGDRNGALNIMACRRDESAVEDPRLGGHGVLTYCLLKALEGENGASKDGTVRAQEVLEYLMRQVPRLSDQLQHPRHSTNYDDEFPMARLGQPGAALNLPPIPSDSVASVDPPSLTSGLRGGASLRVIGAPQQSEYYLIQGKEQRSVGRAFMDGSTLILDGIPPGRYTLIESLAGKQRQWPIEFQPSELRSFELRAVD